MLHLVEGCESGEIATLTSNLARLAGLTPKLLNRAQTGALQWANNIGRESAD
jgi:EAL and modified HD-GYP domain-containing signal transduction protein